MRNCWQRLADLYSKDGWLSARLERGGRDGKADGATRPARTSAPMTAANPCASGTGRQGRGLRESRPAKDPRAGSGYGGGPHGRDRLMKQRRRTRKWR